MKFIVWNDPDPRVVYGNPNLRWSSPQSYLLEEADDGWVPWEPPSATQKKPKKKRSYKMSNPTPKKIADLISAGEDMCDGLEELEVAVGIEQNTFARTRADLDALKTTQNNFKLAEGEEPDARDAVRIADSNGKAFIAASVKVISISLGNEWSDAWIATGLPDNTVGVPGSQDARYAALDGLRAYFAAHPDMEVSTDKVVVTAARALALWTAIGDAREGVGKALKKTADMLLLRDPAFEQFKTRYRQVIEELEGLLEDDDARWYQFGLNRPADPATPGVPGDVAGTLLGGGRALVQVGLSRRANSLNYYKQVVGVDAEPVKVINTEGTQHTIEGLPVGADVDLTVRGVNDAGEGPANVAVRVHVT
jgi:hypothetical protein